MFGPSDVEGITEERAFRLAERWEQDHQDLESVLDQIEDWEDSA